VPNFGSNDNAKHAKSARGAFIFIPCSIRKIMKLYDLENVINNLSSKKQNGITEQEQFHQIPFILS